MQTYYCGARTRQCRKCGHRFSKAEHELWECPECGEDRHCRHKVPTEGARCRYHGGASLRGIDAPRYKHGRYSKYLPDALTDRYHAAQSDPDLLSLREDVALLDTRISDRVQALDAGDSRQLWGQLSATYAAFIQAQRMGKTQEMAEALVKLGNLIKRGGSQGEVWSEIIGLLDQRRKLVESERKRLVDLQQMITTERAMTLVSAIVSSITEHVQDKGALSAIVADLRGLLDQRNGVPARISSGGAIIETQAAREDAP